MNTVEIGNMFWMLVNMCLRRTLSVFHFVCTMNESFNSQGKTAEVVDLLIGSVLLLIALLSSGLVMLHYIGNTALCYLCI